MKRRATVTATPQAPAGPAWLLALEPRMMFDGAVAATVADTVQADPTPQADSASDSQVDDGAAAAPAASSGQRQEIVFIDGNVQDYAQLIAGVSEGTEVVVLDGSQDGLQQIADYLNGRSGIDAIHIVSHGLSGQITLGSLTLDASNLQDHSSTLEAIGSKLGGDGDILLYGCDIALGDKGQSFISQIAAITQADVAASTDATGSSINARNWVLETSTGTIEAGMPFSLAAQNAFTGQLFSGTLNFSGADTILGTPVTDGQAQSSDIPGVTIEIFSADSGNSNNGAAWKYYSDLFTDGAGSQDEGIVDDSGNGSPIVVIRSQDGSEFSFTGIKIVDYLGAHSQIKFEAFQNGVSRGSVTLATDGDYISDFTQGNGLTASIFQYADEIRITDPNGQPLYIGIDNVGFADAVAPNAAPTVSNLNGDSVAWGGAGNTVGLDVGSNASLADAELDALNGGNGDWSGASLVIQRSGTAIGSDVLGFDTSGGLFTVSGSNLQSGGLTFATFTNSGGVLTITFTSSGTTATSALVNDVAQRITYRSDTPAGDATVAVTVNDGAGGSASANVTVTSDTIYVTNATDTATIDRSNGVSFSEAVAIAAADSTGSQTIVFASSLAGQTLNLNAVSLNESLTFDMDQASGLVLTGGTLSLAGGTTQTFTNGSGDTATISSVVAGIGSLNKSGSGSLTLTANNTSTGSSTVFAGTLIVDGNTSSTTTVASGATLAGSGSLGGNVTVQSGGTLSPGNGGAGSLNINGNLSLTAGSTLALDINGTTAGSGYDRVLVNGSANLSGATLAVTHGYTAGSGDRYTVIVNDGGDAITGTFTGISEGGTITAGGNGTELTTSYAGGTGNDLTLTAPAAPVVTNITSSTANGTYKIGDVITVTVQFDTSVNVTGTPTLTLETGATDRILNYVSGSGTDTLSFSYTVQAGDISADLDYASTSALSLNGGTIQDGTSQSAILTLPTPGAAGSLGANKALVVDGVRPAASSITLSDTALRIGETATVTVTFNEAVTNLTIADFSVANGALSGLSSSDGGITWTATFTPGSNVSDASNLITLDNTGVNDLAGNSGSGSTDSGNYAIDTQRPSATVVVADSTLKAGQSTTVTITFNEAVSGLTTADFSVANGALSNLGSVDGGITWTATLTPSANVTAAGNLITLDNTGYTDAAGNTGSGSTDSNSYSIDTQRPSATVVVADSTLKAGQSTTVTITFSEAVSGLTTADFSVANGALSNLASSDGGITWTATLTPNANVTDTSNVITLDNTGYTDAAGNTGTSTTDSNNYAIDSKAPAVTSVGVPANGTYLAGDNLDFTVNFDEAVTVDTSGGTPRLAITLDDGGVVYASYLSGSGSSALVFRLTVANGQQDTDGITVAGGLDANGATLRDGAGNDAQTALNSVGSTSGVLVDAAAPEVTGIALDGSSPTTSDTLGFTVSFNEAVSGVDLGDFALTTSGSASGTLLSLVQLDARTYRVTVGGVSGQGTLGLSLVAAGSGIVDGIGNTLQSGFSSAAYTLGGLTTGDPEFRANPGPSAPPVMTPTPQPDVPVAPPPPTTSPLLPPPLFEQPTLGSGVPTVGTIFLNPNVLAPSFIAQVFASSDSGAGNGSGIGFLGFGGGDGGVFGSSSLSGIFTKDVQQESQKLEVFDGKKWGAGGGGFLSAPTLGQQLQALNEGEQRQHQELAQALQQIAAAQAQI
ncbi:Ig-like domain-containing protein [Pseudomonas sp. REST10]|uniref:Ig-like domain-containing protein n=1 Tax=Pseudomonas sp. REST10 TaxID=2512235 RepID=UPI00240DEDD5|nr:Ig-like domain-containing protein [Pseudomonas sp. REST10]